MRDLLLVALGGALGSVARWSLGGAVQRWAGTSFPWGTFAVNTIGSLAIGVVMGLALGRAAVSMPARLFLVSGVLGGFTTFSAFSFETFALVREGNWVAAAGYAGGSMVLGVAAAAAGYALAMRG